MTGNREWNLAITFHDSWIHGRSPDRPNMVYETAENTEVHKNTEVKPQPCGPPFSVRVSVEKWNGGKSATNLARKSDNLPLFHHEECPLERVT